jgi:hypothetical protein
LTEEWRRDQQEGKQGRKSGPKLDFH